MLIGLFGGTYALLYETLTGEKKQVLKVADLSLILEEDENNLNISGAFPMADEVGMIQDAFTFRLINQGTTSANYQIKLVDITTGSKLSRNDVRYSLIKEGVNKIDYLTSLYKGIIDSGTISGGDEYNYEFRLWIAEEVEDNDKVANKSLSYRVDVEVGQLEETKYIGMIQARSNYNSTELFWKYSSSITSVTFENTISIPNEGIVESWDVSVNKDGSVRAYIEDDGLGTDTYKLHIQGDGVIYANVKSNHLFYNFKKMTSIEGIGYFNTSNATTMEGMFESCGNLTNLDVSWFDTSNVTFMFGMFNGCSSLTSLNVSNFDTSNVTSMQAMFRNCSKIVSLDLSNFDTTKVKSMAGMFYGCSSVVSLDLNNFDTANVTNMEGMFLGCGKLTTLDVSNFDTSNVTSMISMFQNCFGLTELDLSSFDTSNVTSMVSMFNSCSSLKKLDISNFDTSKVTDMNNMFAVCNSLIASMKVTGTKCTTYWNMFASTSTATNASFIVYGDGTNEELINNMLATKSADSNVTYGGVK